MRCAWWRSWVNFVLRPQTERRTTNETAYVRSDAGGIAAGCGGGNQKALVGTWEITDDAGSAYGWGIRFDQDGTFFFAAGAEDNDEELEEAFAAMQVLYTIEYKVKSDTELELTQKLLGGLGGKETTSVAYSFQGDTLIFDGTAYTRVN